MSKKCTLLWREARLEVKSGKNWGVPSTFGRSDVLLRGAAGTRDSLPCQKWAKHGAPLRHRRPSTSRSSTLSTSFPDFSTLFCSCRVSCQVFQLQHSLFQDSSYFHIHLQARDYGGSLAFHLLPLLLLGFARTIHYSPWLCCTDGASAGSTFSFLDNFWPTRSTSKILSKFSGDLLLLQCLL